MYGTGTGESTVQVQKNVRYVRYCKVFLAEGVRYVYGIYRKPLWTP